MNFMNTSYRLETLATKAIIEFNETTPDGIQRDVIECEGGFQIYPPLPAYDEPFLVGEKIPDEVRNKPNGNHHNALPESGFTFINGDELATTAKAPNYLINDILETDAHGILGGASMAFKTFVAIRLAHSICTGKPFAGREVFHAGKVLMACGEGQGALSRRIKAVKIVEGGFNNNLLVLNEPVKIDNKADMARLKLAIDEYKPALFIFDTFASLVSETDENSPSDTGRALRLIKETCRNNHTSSMIIHHHGKDIARGLRGASNFTNDMDFTFSLEREPDSMITTLSCKKMKDGDNFTEIYLEAVPVDLGLERQDGKPATSLIIKESSVAPPKKNKIKMSLNDDKSLQVLRKVIERDGILPPDSICNLFQDSPENIPKKVINIESWRIPAYEAFTVTSKDPKNEIKTKEATFRRGYEKFEKAYLIGIHGGYVWLI
jgi:hypothetical protein